MSRSPRQTRNRPRKIVNKRERRIEHKRRRAQLRIVDSSAPARERFWERFDLWSWD